MRRHNIRTQLTAFLLIAFALITIITYTAAENEAAPAPPTGLLTSNGIWLEANLPLPVFQFLPPEVTGDGSVRLASQFSAIGRGITPAQDEYLGRSRFTIYNESTNTVLEQYGATGGFYAFNPSEAFGEAPRGSINPVIAQQLACQFLLSNQMFPDNDLIGTPNVQLCDFDFNANPYNVSLISAAAADAGGRALGQQTLGAVVEVPMFVKTGRYSQIPTVPLGGAGGHLSLLFRTTDFNDAGFTLDNDAPGLGAVAMPFYDRALSFLNTFPTRDPQAALAEVTAFVRSSYPNATRISVPEPALRYVVGDAAQPQVALEPMLEFENIEVEDGGELINLRSIVIPALEKGSDGFGPNVTILSPDDGSRFAPGTAVSLTGQIAGGAPPYTYIWRNSDGVELAAGTLTLPGAVSAVAADLAVVSHGGIPAGIVIELEAQDSVGAVRQTAITIYPTVAPSSYLPAVVKNAPAPSANFAFAETPGSIEPQAVTAVYRFGVHAGSDYPPYGSGGSDLPGVIPDATGFRSAMLSYGWTATYNWWNASAWEKDWRDCGLGGIDCTAGVDRVDFAYYAGHGGPGGISLPSNKDSSWFDGANARYSTLRWAGFAACQTLRVQGYAAGSEPIRRWFGAFQGAHMLLGFNNNMRDVAFGPRLVDNMRMPTFLGIPLPGAQRTIREAWVQTAFQMNAGKPAYIYAIGTNGVNPVNNKLPRSGDPALPRPYPVASYNWVWWNE
jgi:hypothetical protein